MINEVIKSTGILQVATGILQVYTGILQVSEHVQSKILNHLYLIVFVIIYFIILKSNELRHRH